MPPTPRVKFSVFFSMTVQATCYPFREHNVCVRVGGNFSVFLETVLKDLCSALPREMMVYFQIQSNLIVVIPNDIQRTNTLQLNE